ncbi:hypothetical protein ACJX0J_012945, partial [Zea mays]
QLFKELGKENKLKEDRFWPYFKGAIGAIDGSHTKFTFTSDIQIERDTLNLSKGLRTKYQNFLVLHYIILFTTMMSTCLEHQMGIIDNLYSIHNFSQQVQPNSF